MDNFISQKSTEYADSKLDKDCPYSKNVQRKERQFDWADIADAFESGARWYREELAKDIEESLKEINENGFATFLKNHQSVFMQDANGDMMRKVDEL